MKDNLPDILEKKPWIGAEEGKDLTDKIEETRNWLEDKIAEQTKAGLTADPVLTQDQVVSRVEKVAKMYRKVTDKKKPKEKKPKVEKTEEQEQEKVDKEEDL